MLNVECNFHWLHKKFDGSIAGGFNVSQVILTDNEIFVSLEEKKLAQKV